MIFMEANTKTTSLSQKGLKLSNQGANLIIALNELCKNQRFLKLIKNIENNPLDLNTPPITTTDVLDKNIFIVPYNEEVPKEQKVEVRIFFSDGYFNESNSIFISNLVFQIILHRDLEKIFLEDKTSTLRSFEIMNEIVNSFKTGTFETLGTVHFKGYELAHIDKDYFMYSITSEVMGV